MAPRRPGIERQDPVPEQRHHALQRRRRAVGGASTRFDGEEDAFAADRPFDEPRCLDANRAAAPPGRSWSSSFHAAPRKALPSWSSVPERDQINPAMSIPSIPFHIRTLQVDAGYLYSICKAGLYDEIWQAFAVPPPVRTMGVMGDGCTYDQVCALKHTILFSD